MPRKLLVIGFVWPEPKSSAAGWRMIQLIKAFQQENYQITFASASSKTENALDLRSMDVAAYEIQLNNSSFDVFVKKQNPDVVLFDRFMVEEQFGWRVAEQCPNALRILDTEDLHGLRKGRQQALKKNKPFDRTCLFNDTSKREIASIYRSDLSLIISEKEMDILTNQFRVDKNILHYVPFLLNSISEEQVRELPDFKDREHFITIGNFIHEPNYQGILYLKQDIWPIIKKRLPEAEMHVYGAYASKKVTELNDEGENFFIQGFAEDVNSVMRKAKVCLVPLKFGAGLKGKIVDAMKNGTPSVTTTIGAEGLYSAMDPNGFVENNPEEFAQRAIELYTDSILWKKKQLNGFEIINNRFDKNLFLNNFFERVSNLKGNLKEHRLENFTGSMLQHHTLNSVKYLGKWIEEKNKNIT